MVHMAYLLPLVYWIGFFIANLSYDVSAIGSAIPDGELSASAIEDIENRPMEAFGLLVPLEEDESGEEHHKSKRCWKARPFRKMKLSCGPNGIYKTNAESIDGIGYNSDNFAGRNKMVKEQLPYLGAANDLYGDEKRSAEESSEESWNSDERSEDNRAGKIPSLRIAPMKNPQKNLQALFKTEEKSQDDTTSNEYEENSEDLILKKIKNHLNSNHYNVLALVGKRADHAPTTKSKKKYFCYCSQPNCPRDNCQRIKYRPCSNRRNLKPIFVGRANNYHENDVEIHRENEETQTVVDERIPVNIHYPFPKNHRNEYFTNNDVPSKNDPRLSPLIGKPLQPSSMGEEDRRILQHNQRALIDARNHGFFYESPRRTVHINRNNNIEQNANQDRIFGASGSGVNSVSSNRYLVSQPEPVIGSVYPAIPVRPNTNNHKTPCGQWAVNSYDPFSGRTGNPIPRKSNQMITQDSFITRYTNNGFADSTMPLTNQRIMSYSQHPGSPYSQISKTLERMQPGMASLHPISNDGYDNKFLGNSHHGSDGYNWNVPNGMRSQLYYPQQYYYRTPFERLKPTVEPAMDDQETPESMVNSDEDSTSLKEPVILDEEKNDIVEKDEETNTRFDFEDAKFDISAESELGAQANHVMSNENQSDELLNNNPEDESHDEDVGHGNEHPKVIIDDSKLIETTKTTVPLIPDENHANAGYQQSVNYAGDFVNIDRLYEDVSDEDPRYEHPSVSPETIYHFDSHKIHDTSLDHELLISENKKDTTHSIEGHNTDYQIDETTPRTQIERPTEVKPTWNRYSDEGSSNPVIQPEDNYRFDQNRHSMVNYNPIHGRPRLDQYPEFISQTKENYGSLHRFPVQEILTSKGDSELIESQPKNAGMGESDLVYISNSDGREFPGSEKDDYSDIREETNEFIISQADDDVKEISDKNIQVKGTESMHFSQFVEKSSGDADTLHDSTQYDGSGRTSNYEESFRMTHSEDNFAPTTDVTESEGDDSNESLTMQGHEVLGNSDADVFTESGEQISEHEAKITHEIESSASLDKISSDEEIVGENEPIVIQEGNENIAKKLIPEDASANFDSKIISEASISAEKSLPEIVGKKMMESENESNSTGEKNNYEVYSSIQKETSKSSEGVIERDDYEDTIAENKHLVPADILKEETAASAEDKSDGAIPEHADVNAKNYFGKGLIGSYEDDNSYSEDHRNSFDSTGENPSLSNDENSEKVGVARNDHVAREDEMCSCSVLNEPKLPIEDTPTRYFSPNDRVLEYIKNHSADLLASKHSTATGRDEQRVESVLHHTEQSESGPQSEEIDENLSRNEKDWRAYRTEISDRNNEQKTVNTETNYESSEEDGSSGNEHAAGEGNSYLMHLNENTEKNFKTLEHHKNFDDSALDSESDASDSDETREKTINYVKQSHGNEKENSKMKVSSILEHRKNSADDEITQNYENTPEFIADYQTHVKTHMPIRTAENNEEDVTGFSYLMHLNENTEKNFKTWEHHKNFDDSALDSESDASDSDETREKTINYVKQSHGNEKENSKMKVSSILEHRKNSADDEITQNYENAPEFIADTKAHVKTHMPMQTAENNEEGGTESNSTEVVGQIHHRENPEYLETLDSTESHELKSVDAISRIKDFKQNKETARVAEVPKKSIATTYDHNSEEFLDHSLNVGNTKELSTGSDYNKNGITHLQKKLPLQDYDESESSGDLEPSKESGESTTHHVTDDLSSSKHALRNDRGKAKSTVGTTSTCGCSLAGRKATPDDDKNDKRISLSDLLNSSHDEDGEDMVAIKHRENYNSAEETASEIETQERQSQELINRKYGEMNDDDNLELGKKASDFSREDTDQYVGVENPVTQYTTEGSSSDVEVDQDEEFAQYSFETEKKTGGTGENLSATGEKTFLEDGTENVKEEKTRHATQGTQSIKDSYSLSHGNARGESPASIQVEKNLESEKFSGEEKEAEFIGSVRSLQQGSCTKPPEVQDDVGYVGKLVPKKLNSGVESLGDLVGSDLYYIGDGVRLPLTIKKLRDGSFALSISDKICEQRIAEKCPCCVPRKGRILQEKHGDFNAEEPLGEIDSTVTPTDKKSETNEEVVEMKIQALNRDEHQLERSERALDVDDESKNHNRVTRSIMMPVDEFIEKYELNLNLDDVLKPEDPGELTGIESRLNHNVIQRNEARDDAEEQNGSLVQKFASMNELPQNASADVMLTTLENLIASEPANIDVVIDGIKKELREVNEEEKPGEYHQEKVISRVQNDGRGYQRGNLILDRIAIMKNLQDKKYRCEHRYQKDCVDAITEKTKLLTRILYFLKDLVIDEQN